MNITGESTYKLCNMALNVCCFKASCVGGINSISLLFVVKNARLHEFTSSQDLLRSYNKTTNRSIN